MTNNKYTTYKAVHISYFKNSFEKKTSQVHTTHTILLMILLVCIIFLTIFYLLGNNFSVIRRSIEFIIYMLHYACKINSRKQGRI